MSGRPLVVLAGWLGCQPRHLRRYQLLYEKLGIQSTITVTPPRLVVGSTFRQPVPPTRVPPEHRDWTNPNNNYRTNNIQTTNDLAWSVLRQVHESQSPYFLFHSFSNGGCFLWEEIRNILNASIEAVHSPNDDNDNNNNDTFVIQQKQRQHQEEFANIRLLRDKLVGVVFDSSPAAFGDVQNKLGVLHRVLEYCTWQERWPLLLEIHTKTWFQPNFVADVQHRARTYYAAMRDDPWNLPQLYLYSEDDALTTFAPLDELVKHRQELFGPDVVSFKRWKSSAHCRHLLEHPQDYEQAVQGFVARHWREDRSGSYPEPPLSKL